MYRTIVILLSGSLLFSCNIRSSRNKPDVAVSSAGTFKDSTTVQMIDSVYDFGKVADGDKVEHSFRFRNTGKNPLIISDASASCGCTVPEKPEAPIQPGETGFLKVVFNSKGKVGQVNKAVTVTSNAYPRFPVLEVKGEVTEQLK